MSSLELPRPSAAVLFHHRSRIHEIHYTHVVLVMHRLVLVRAAPWIPSAVSLVMDTSVPKSPVTHLCCCGAYSLPHPLVGWWSLVCIRRGTLFSDEHMREKEQGYIMLYDMLLGKGSIQGGGKLKVGD